MIYIFKLSTGEEVIGSMDYKPYTYDYFNIDNPMQIVGGITDSALRLRNMLLLSCETMISIPAKHVITSYDPSQAVVDYYEKAVKYHDYYTKKDIDLQIKQASKLLESEIKREQDRPSGFSMTISKASTTH